jgi:hypothetical protein
MRLNIALAGSFLLVPALSRPQKVQGGGSWGKGEGFRGGFGGVIVEDGVAHGASGTFSMGSPGKGGFSSGTTIPVTLNPGKFSGNAKGRPKSFNLGPAGSGGTAKGASGGTFNFGPAGNGGKQSRGQPNPQLPARGPTPIPNKWDIRENQV